jgi:hypothetical protein
MESKDQPKDKTTRGTTLKIMNQCTICLVDFSLENEGGIEGNFGILPVSFCPTCFSCVMDMADQLNESEEQE